MRNIGPQYEPDDQFKAAARLHQSAYRANVLKVGFDQYGNRLTESAGRALLNYYDGLGLATKVPDLFQESRCGYAQERAYPIQSVRSANR